MTVRPPLHILLALLLGVLCAFGVACGQQRQGLIAPSRADDIKTLLDKIDDDVAAGRCDALADHLAALNRQVGDLPGTVDRGLRARIRSGESHLTSQAPDECSANTQTTDTTPDTTPTVPPDTTPTVPQDTTPTVPPATTPTTPPATTPQQTTPAQTTPPATTPGNGNGGGAQAPDGQSGGITP